jgi:hypothetical protein
MLLCDRLARLQPASHLLPAAPPADGAEYTVVIPLVDCARILSDLKVMLEGGVLHAPGTG